MKGGAPHWAQNYLDRKDTALSDAILCYVEENQRGVPTMLDFVTLIRLWIV